ncbi:hypothetical protein ACP70R_048037 [Stipagrostis hirtigluma subsp. patula]
MMTAAAASGENGGKKWQAALPCSTSAAVAMCAVSHLFVGLTAWLLRPSDAGDEKEFSDVVWTLSPPICAYLFFWTAALSETARGAAAVLVRVSSLLLLAVAAAAVAGTVAGSAGMFLATVYSAASCARALAERRQLAGTERSAAAQSAALRYRSRAEERHDQEFRTLVVLCMIFLVPVPLLLLLLDRWRRSSSPEPVSELELRLVVVAAGPCLVAARLLLLRGGPLEGGNSDGMVCLAVTLILLCCFVATVCVFEFVGGVGMMVYFWVAAMGTAGYLGYGLAVHARYEQLITFNRRQPRPAQDASGLLVGRDEEDAVSAHI